MNKFEHGIKQIFEHLPIEIFPTKGVTALFREEPKFASLSLFFAHGIPIGRQACAHCAIAGADKNAVRPAKKQCEMYN